MFLQENTGSLSLGLLSNIFRAFTPKANETATAYIS